MLWRRFASLLLRAGENKEIFATTSAAALITIRSSEAGSALAAKALLSAWKFGILFS